MLRGGCVAPLLVKSSVSDLPSSSFIAATAISVLFRGLGASEEQINNLLEGSKTPAAAAKEYNFKSREDLLKDHRAEPEPRARRAGRRHELCDGGLASCAVAGSAPPLSPNFRWILSGLAPCVLGCVPSPRTVF